MTPLRQSLAIHARGEATLQRLFQWQRINAATGTIAVEEYHVAVYLQRAMLARAMQVVAIFPAANEDGPLLPEAA